MNKCKYLFVLTGMIIFLSSAIASVKDPVSTIAIAENVLQKGIKTIDLGLYPGILLMHGMTELVLIHPEKKEDLLKHAIELYKKYPSKEIVGRGSYICYEVGGSGAALLYQQKLADILHEQVDDGAKRMIQNQKRSTEGLLIPPSKTENQVFIDMAFAVTPYFLYSGLALNRPEEIDLAVYETLELFRILEDKETGLVHQGRGFQGKDVISQDNWSRGNGWGAFALATLVRDLPESHPKRQEVVNLAKSFFTAALKLQDKNGLWHQEITDKTSYIETSGSGLLLYGLGIMLEKRLLDEKYRANLINGLRNYLSYIGCDGSVNNTCMGCLCPGKGTKEDYRNRDWAFNDPHAFGPVVLSFTQAYKIGIKNLDPIPGEGCTSIYDTLPGTPRTYVRLISERKEDLAWENDRIAFRVFGPPVKDIVGSGIDVWPKSVKYPIINKWYLLNSKGKAYHIDRGEGCDFYDMGYYRGCGGLAIWENDKPYASQTWAKHRILKNNEDEIIFEMTYNNWDVNGYKVSEKKVISMKMGTNLFKVTSTINTERKGELMVGIGVTTFGNPDIFSDEKSGILSSWEKVHPEHGFLGTAVIVNPENFAGFKSFEKDRFALIKVRPGEPFTYYVGAGWDGNPAFPRKTKWTGYLSKEAKKLF